jgi:cation:H+ antiporter
MEHAAHAIFFLATCGVVWFFAGLLVNAVGRLAHNIHRSGFTVAFVLLGLLTSISELSVAANATLEGVPQVSAGNLAGASFVLLFFAVPLLAIASRRVALRHVLSQRNLKLALAVAVLPVLLLVDGEVTRADGALMLLGYVAVLSALWHRGSGATVPSAASDAAALPMPPQRVIAKEITLIVMSGIAIFAASRFLVEQVIYFSHAFHAPPSLVALLLLSIGTNLPELAVAVRSILSRQQEIAFGDYLGSAVTNTPVFGFLAIANGTFAVQATEPFLATTALMVVGSALLYGFAKSGRAVTRGEGIALVGFYACFLGVQISLLLGGST